MPYVDKNSRDKYIYLVHQINLLHEIETKGDLEYLVMKLYRKFMSTREKRYTTLHDATYAIQHVADETRRRFLDARETQAMEVNGDV